MMTGYNCPWCKDSTGGCTACRYIPQFPPHMMAPYIPVETSNKTTLFNPQQEINELKRRVEDLEKKLVGK